MTRMKNQLRVRKQDSSQAPKQDSTQGVGGREFGQVIEPMQAQMASGNEGLAEQSSPQSMQESSARHRKMPHKGRKAA